MNRTLKEATVTRYYYESHARVQEYLDAFINACNFFKETEGITRLDIVRIYRQKLAGTP